MILRISLLALLAFSLPSIAADETDFYRMEFEIDVDRPATEVWSKVGGYCDIEEWLGFDCEISQGDGGLGTVRVLAGTVVEPLVAKGDLFYAYSQAPKEGVYYDSYHGFMEARPVTDSTSKILLTVVWDKSHQDEETFQSSVESRTELFNNGMQKMKEIAESD